MSFFNLTELGYQYPIRAQVKEPNPVYTYNLSHRIPEGSYVSFRPETSKLPPIDMHKYNNVIEPVDHPEHHGSYVKYTERLHKHTRCAKGPLDLYRNPVTTAQIPGSWYHKEIPLKQREPWTHVPRHIHVSSEMTKFVKEMSQTNREFSLF
ncbi:sperm microtubule inner protein 11-like [Diadema antillarum]|uniref:sperm microtubule inner protein 11-like n=1 Tax=Diadema antillarum TaxID=105358 RepID=UPI003A8A7453